MTKNFILYIVVFILTVYLSLLYDGTTMRFLIAFELVLPAIMFVMLIIQKKCVQVVLSVPITSIGKNENIIIKLQVSQKVVLVQKFFPVHNIMVRGRYTDISGSVKPLKEKFELHYSESGQYNITLPGLSEHYGVIGISIDKVKIYDYMHLFALQLPVRYENNVYILPQTKASAVDINALKSAAGARLGDMLAASAGSSFDSITGMREYRQGDHIKSIHWKLSARMDELMVKEYEGETSANVLLFVDGINTDDKDGWIEQVYFTGKSLSGLLLEYDIGWLCDNMFVSHTTGRAEGLLSVMCIFLKAQQDKRIESTKSSRNKVYMDNGFLEREYTTIIKINSNGVISVNGEELA